jgi:phosphate/phosphite/phosphonate ABC transporter binding protein
MNSIGRFQLLERIALGGMAEIFLAFERGTAGFERLVVIKRLRQEFASDQIYLDMFLREARTIARLNHPNIVKVHELGEHEGSWYIAMEYVAGASFRELLVAVRRDERKLPLNVAVGLLLRACAGAHGAHELRDAQGEQVGLVHRDISPDNLMVETTGHVKLLDFGIAKVVTRDESTRMGTLKGKIAYMSPEQCQQKALDRRSDVFSLGIVGWELIAAARLFKRDSDYASMQAIVTGDQRDLVEYRPDCPEPLRRIISTALAPEADDRYPTADALRRDLIQLAERQHWDVTLDALAPTIVEFTGERQDTRARELEAAVVAKLEGPDDFELDDLLDEPTPVMFKTPKPDRRPEVLLAGGIALTFVFGLGIWAMQSQTPQVAPVPEPVIQPDPGPSGEPLTIALAPVMDETLYLEAHEALRQHLEEELDRPVMFQAWGSYDALGQALLDGHVVYASMPPYLYLQTLGEEPDLALLAMKLIDGSMGSDGVLLVREDSDVDELADLAGKRICFTDPSSTTGWALPRAALREVDALGDDTLIHLSGNHLQAIRDLDGGLCDAAGTYSGAWLGADRAGIQVGRLRVLGLTGRSPQDAMVAGPDTHETERAAIKAALLSFENPGAVGVERITGYVDAVDPMYDALREALAEEVR